MKIDLLTITEKPEQLIEFASAGVLPVILPLRKAAPAVCPWLWGMSALDTLPPLSYSGCSRAMTINWSAPHYVGFTTNQRYVKTGFVYHATGAIGESSAEFIGHGSIRAMYADEKILD